MVMVESPCAVQITPGSTVSTVGVGPLNEEQERATLASTAPNTHRLIMGGDKLPKITPVVTTDEILKARTLVRRIYMDEKIETYITDIVFATRFPKDYGMPELEHLINYGGSPRASINLAMASKAYAFLKRRGYVIPEDVREICHDILRHRIGLTYEAEAENITQEDIINKILDTVEVP